MKPIHALQLPAILALSLLIGCGSSAPEGIIEEETFIETYVALRVAALGTDSSRVADDDRQAILAAHQITEDDLLDFVRFHAADLEYMREVWNEVELRMDRSPEVAEEG